MKGRDELLAEAHTILSFLYSNEYLNLSECKKAELYDLWIDEGRQFVEDYKSAYLNNTL